MKEVIGFDTESYYDDEVSVRPLGAWMYSRHPRCDVYLISVADETGSWAGHPRDFNFDSLKGKTLVSHNSAFDEEMYYASVEKGLWPKIDFKEWHCTANLSAFLCNRRSLDDAADFLFDLKLSKEMRNYMKGKTWEDAVREGKAEQLLQYARDDAAICRRIWVEHSHKWPERERRLSRLTIDQGRRGVHIHQERLNAGIERLQRVILASTDKLPWVAAGRPPASPRGVAEACRASNIPPPPVKAHDADGAAEWEEKYSSSMPWVKALKDLRKSKKMLATYETIKRRLRPDGTMGFSLKYFGAATGRWAGDAGINMQNFNREPLFVANDALLDTRAEIEARLPVFSKNPDAPELGAVDLRGLFLPPPGHKMAMVDLSQIEPRVLNWLAGNFGLLAKIENGFPIYEAHARDSMGWTGGNLKKEHPKTYSLAKARCLAGNTLVLTELRGYVPIRKLTTTDRVWDGVEWVLHDGLINQGNRPVTTKMGESATDDHVLFTPDGTKAWGEIHEGEREALAAFRRVPTSEWHDVWKLACAVLRETGAQWNARLKVSLHRMWVGDDCGLQQFGKWKDAPLPSMRYQGGAQSPTQKSVGPYPHATGAVGAGAVASDKGAL